MNAGARIRIVIADDHPIVRDGLVAILSTQSDFEIAAEAADGAELVARARALRPDVILTDLEMPVIDGVEAIRQIRAALPTANIIVFTVFDTDDKIVGALQAGARGYLLKGTPRAQIFEAIRVVNAGGSLLHPMVTTRLIEHVRDPGSPPIEALTPRELEVLRLLASGAANKSIAAVLHITERTVKFHVSAILGKLAASNRTEAVSIAVAHGLITR